MLLRMTGALALLGCLLSIATTSADEPAVPTVNDEDFVPLFNGTDLSNWVDINVNEDTFTVRDEMIICSGQPTGVMRTDRMYENFVMEIEWRHLRPRGNAGVFVWSDGVLATRHFTRAIEVQVLDGRETNTYTSHGDIFAIHGARLVPDREHPTGAPRCLPSERRSNPSPEWNHYRITCYDGRITLAVNGAVVSGGSECNPRKGYICLESEGSPVEFRNLRIAELPSTDPEADEIAKPAEEE